MKMPKVVSVDVDKVEPNTWNPNSMDERTQKALSENIRRFGFNQPLLLRPHPRKAGFYEIIDGEHRWQTARLSGADKIDSVVIDADDDLAMAETIAMNRIHGDMSAADVAVMLLDIEGEIPYDELETFSGYERGELDGIAGLLDFDWSEITAKNTTDEECHTLGWRLPQEASETIQSEIERLKGVLGTEYDHLALELMVVNSGGLLS